MSNMSIHEKKSVILLATIFGVETWTLAQIGSGTESMEKAIFNITYLNKWANGELKVTNQKV